MNIGRLVADTTEAFSEALWYCRVFGLNWKNHIVPVKKDGVLAGYYVIDETGSTIVAKIKINAVYEM